MTRRAEVPVGFAVLAALSLNGCPRAPANGAAPPATGPRDPVASVAHADPDAGACAQLCAREASCHAALSAEECAQTCAADAARMKPGFVAGYVRCYLSVLNAHCGEAVNAADAGHPSVTSGGTGPAAMDDEARGEAHLRCFDAALAGFPRDEDNQRDMAEAVCRRGERCLGIGPLGRDACMEATLHPHEADVQLGQRLVDALRRSRAQSFRACVEAAPCPHLDAHDDVVNRCYAETIGGAR